MKQDSSLDYTNKYGEIGNLNNGYIGHRIEDRLGLERDSVLVSGDDDGTIAEHEILGRIPVLDEDLYPY